MYLICVTFRGAIAGLIVLCLFHIESSVLIKGFALINLSLICS